MLYGILGGSFDPVHLGHLAMAEHMLERKLADSLLIIPAWLSPHKYENSATPSDRLAMVRLAFAAMGDVMVDNREIARGEDDFLSPGASIAVCMSKNFFDPVSC